MQQNSKPAKRRQNVLLLSVSHCRAVTIWGQPFKKLPQIHLCTIDCFEALCKTVVTVFFHYSTAKVAVLVLLKSNAVDEEEALNCVCELLLCCLLPRDSRGRNRLNSCSFFSTHLEEEVTCLPKRLQKKASRSQDLETAAFSARSIPNQSFLLCCPNLYVQSLLSYVRYLITVHHL